MERISQIVLIVVGALVLMVLTVGLAVSCRQQPPDASATPTPLSTLAPTWTPLSGADLTGTVTAAAPIPAGQTATPTPTPFAPTPGVATPDVATPGGIVTPGGIATPGGIVTPGGATPTPGAGTPGGPTATPPTGATPPGGATPAPIASPPPNATAAPPAATATPITYVPGATVRHTVNRGEWLLQIARCYGAPYAGVHAANALPDPDFILPGQVIIVPNVGTIGRVIGPPCVQAYFVQAGDTWESLATRFGTTTAILQRANPGALTLGRAIWAPRN